MLPKAQYMKLSPAAKADVKRSLGMDVKRPYSRVKRLSSRAKGRPLSYVTPRRSTVRRSPAKGTPWHKGLAESAGGMLGSYFGPLGSKIGASAGKLFSKVTGFGDYKVQSNTLITGASPPLFASAGRGTLVRHREYLGDVYSAPVAGAFNVQGFAVNPGLATTFEWLAQIANNFEQYCIRGMIFEYKAMSADALNSTNTALGTVIMATQYNSAAAAFTSKAQMEGHEFCTSSRPSASFVHPIECSRAETPLSCLYTRSGSVPSSTDQRFYDLGTFYIGVQGMQAADVNLGELWVTYDVELLKPRIYDGIGNDVLADHWRLYAADTSNYLGTSQGLRSGNLGITFSSNNVFELPVDAGPMYYMCQLVWRGASTTLTNAIALTLGSACTLPNFFLNDLAGVGLIAGTVSTTQFNSFIVLVAAGGVSGTTHRVTISAGTVPGTPTYADLVVSEWSPSVITRSPSDSKALVTRSSVPSVVRRPPPGICAKQYESGEDKEPSDDDEEDVEAEYELMLIERKKAEISAWKATKESKDELPLPVESSSMPPSHTHRIEEPESPIHVKKPSALTPVPTPRVLSRK